MADAELGYDGKPFVVAARLSAPKKTGDVAFDQQAILERKCLARIVDQLIKDPRYTLPLHAHLLNMDLSALSGPRTKQNDTWTGSYKFLNQIPRSWMATFILKRARTSNLVVLNEELLAKLEEDDTANIPQLFSFMIQLPLSLGFPKDMQDAWVASEVFTKRCDEVHDRLEYFVRLGGVTPTGKLDFKKAGCFTFEFDEKGLCTKLSHCSGLHIVPPTHAPITIAFELIDNYLDGLSFVLLEPRRDPLNKLFALDAAFRFTMFEPGKKCTLLKEFAKEVKARVDEQQAARTTAATTNTAVLEPGAKKRSKVTTDRARVQLAAAAEKRQRRRSVALSTA